MNEIVITDIGLNPFGLTKEETELLLKKYLWIKEKVEDECDLRETVD